MLTQFILATAAAIGPGSPTDARAQPAPEAPAIVIRPIGSFRTGPFNTLAAEIAAYDPSVRSLFVTNSHTNALDVLSIADPTRPARVRSIGLGSFGRGVNSVAAMNGLVAVAVEGHVKTDPGRVVVFDAVGTLVGLVEVGALPDMLTFTPDGRRLVVANEGEPSDDYTVDPEGSVSIIDLPGDPRRLGQRHVRTATFTRFDGGGLDPGVRVFGPGAAPSRDLEPEYIAVSADSRTAYVVLQENNALALVDLDSATVTRIVPLGFKDHSQHGNGLDPSDRDGGIRIGQAPVRGMFQPDTIVRYETGGTEYLITADEGDARYYAGFAEAARVADLSLDPSSFPDAAELQRPERLGRLHVSRASGDEDGDGLYESLYAFGARGFSIRDASGGLVFHSGDAFEKMVASAAPEGFNSNNTSNDSRDARSDDRGPEPEAIAVGSIAGRHYAFIGLERVGGIVVFDVTEPARSTPVGYWTTRHFAGDPVVGTAGDLGPECLVFIPADLSPNGEHLLVSVNEISGTVTVAVVRTR
tara:strand:+ start:20768 stop:22348 length:1581 start_codon:yes stop_codon:yes gene_type:complete